MCRDKNGLTEEEFLNLINSKKIENPLDKWLKVWYNSNTTNKGDIYENCN